MSVDSSHGLSTDAIKRRVFLSYGRDQFSNLALQIKNDLQKKGYDVWFDLDRIKEGGDWEKYIEDGLAWVSESPRPGKLSLLMTPYSVRRPDGFCLNEVARAVQMGLPIVPVMVAWCEPPLSICRIQWLDMQDCVPLAEKSDRYLVKLARLIEALEDEKITHESVQSRLINLLDPLPFDADITWHTGRFIGREWVFERIDAWLRDEKSSRIFWIAGPPGIGKTAIASWLCYRYREVGAFHFCRFGHLQRADPKRFVLSIAYQLSTQLPEYQQRLKDLKLEQIVHNSDARTIFDLLISQPLSGNFPCPDRRILVVVDALDEAAGNGGNELTELVAVEFPKTPAWLRLIVTSRNDPDVAHLLQDYRPFLLDAGTEENRADLHRYLEVTLGGYFENGMAPTAAIDAIVARSEGNFLYAERVGEELSRGNLTLDRIEDFPQGLGGAYVQYFKRQFSDTMRYKGTMRPLLEAIIVAQEPLSVDFITSQFGWNEYDAEEILDALGSLFTRAEGTVRPFHRSLADWVTNKERAGPYYVSAREGHRRLADFGIQAFKKDPAALSAYLLAYLPFHLISLGRWDELKMIMENPVFFDRSWGVSQHNIRRYWDQIEANSPYRVVDVYHPIIESPAGHKEYFTWKIAILLADMGHYRESMKIYQYLIGHYRKSGDFADLQACLGNLSILMQKSGSAKVPAGSETSFVCGPDDKNALIAALNDQAHAHFMVGSLDQAMDLFKEAERLCRETNDGLGLSVCLNDEARIHYIRGDFDATMALLKEIERICRELNNHNGLAIALNNRALLLYESGDLDGAMGLFVASERIVRDQNNKNGLLICKINRANILYDWGRLDEALVLYREAEGLSFELNNRSGLHISIGNQALVLGDKGDIEGALKLHLEEENICRELGDKIGLEASLNAQGVIMYETGRLESALRLFKESGSLSRALGHKVGLQNSLGNQGLISRDIGDVKAALRLHEEEEAICRELGNKLNLQVSLCNRAAILYASGNVDEAMGIFSDTLAEFRKSKYVIGEQLCLNGMALIRLDGGDTGGSMNLLMEARDMCRRIGYKRGLQAANGNLAIARYRMGDLKGSYEYLEEAERICREIGYVEGLAIALTYRAVIDIFAFGRTDEGLAMTKEAKDIAESCSIPTLSGRLGPLIISIEGRAHDGKILATDGTDMPGLAAWPVKMAKQEKK